MAWLINAGFSEAYLEQEKMLGLHGGSSLTIPDTLEHWKDDLAEPGTLEYHEQRGLPVGTERKTGVGYEEVSIPAAKKTKLPDDEELVDISELDNWAQLAFIGTKKLNRIQSAVFNTAYTSSENMLVCAPTGAGKTNIAMLTFLQLVKQVIL
jgi:hypothetical protein